MIDGIRLKVCGITSLVDAEFADECGADYLGFIFYPQSPRRISLIQYRAMSPRLPARRKVAVSVEPTIDELSAMRDAGFDYFQIHFRHDLPVKTVEAWSGVVGAKHLWLAPKLPPAVEVPRTVLSQGKFIMLDTYQAEGFGGSGKTGDWQKFARHQDAYRENFWILAGGLNAENIAVALVESGARFVDVNSGVERTPGIKDHAKLKQFAVAIHQSRSGGGGRT